jgi:hypothetical protein
MGIIGALVSVCEALCIEPPKGWNQDFLTSQMMNALELNEFSAERYLSNSWASWFEGLSVRHEPEGETTLSGMLDQTALQGIFTMLWKGKPNVC